MIGASIKRAVTFDGEPVTRDVSIDDVKEYVIRKGFRFANRGIDGESWTLAKVGDVNDSTPFVYFTTSPAAKATIQDIAYALKRKARDVLREIADHVEPST